MEIMLKNKCCLYVIISIRFFSITICNLLIEFPSYNKNNTTAIIGFNSILAENSMSKIALINKIYKHRQKHKTANTEKLIMTTTNKSRGKEQNFSWASTTHEHGITIFHKSLEKHWPSDTVAKSEKT